MLSMRITYRLRRLVRTLPYERLRKQQNLKRSEQQGGIIKQQMQMISQRFSYSFIFYFHLFSLKHHQNKSIDNLGMNKKQQSSCSCTGAQSLRIDQQINLVFEKLFLIIVVLKITIGIIISLPLLFSQDLGAIVTQSSLLILIFLYIKSMVSLKSQKRLAAEVLKCGRKRVWMDPSEVEQIGQANSRVFVRKLIKDGLIMKRKQKVHSRARARKHLQAKRQGRHTGPGKRRGTLESRMPTKILWVRRQRVLRRLLKKYRAAKKIDRTIYHKFYLASKGNQFKNRTVLIEAIFKQKTKKIESDKLEAQQEARRQKNQERRKKRTEKQERL